MVKQNDTHQHHNRGKFMEADLQHRIAREYSLPLQVSSFFALLILAEHTTPASAFGKLGCVEARGLVYKLRKQLKSKAPEIEIYSQHGVGYWLNHDTRRNLAIQFGVELGITLCTLATLVPTIV
jgi:hypothetical protein